MQSVPRFIPPFNTQNDVLMSLQDIKDLADIGGITAIDSSVSIEQLDVLFKMIKEKSDTLLTGLDPIFFSINKKELS